MATELRTKTFSSEIKSAKTVVVKHDDPDEPDTNLGVITSRFATLDVLDHDQDVIRPKAAGKQKVGAGSYNHMPDVPTPPGYGDTREEKNQALADLTYFLDTWTGKETYTYLKGMYDAKRPVEWSMKFYVKKGNPLSQDDPLFPDEHDEWLPPYEIKKMDIVSVDPVDRGAGYNTGMVDAKGCDGACEARRAGSRWWSRSRWTGTTTSNGTNGVTWKHLHRPNRLRPPGRGGRRGRSEGDGRWQPGPGLTY